MKNNPASALLIYLTLGTLTVAGIPGSDPQTRPASPWLTRDLDRGEAVVWYSFHSGWAVRTENHFVVFDYIGPGSTAGAPSPKIFAARLEKAGLGGAVGIASRPGDRFFFSGGKLVSSTDH